MIKRAFLPVLALLLLAGFSQAQKKSGKIDTKPNIIFIYADDLGYAELGAYGQKKIKTPNLDKMAKEGMRFTQFYTSTPVCAPARCMLMTGRHGGHSYIRGNYEMGGFPDSLEGGQMPLPENTFTVGRMLQQAGYKTAVIGKWGLGMNTTTGDPNKQGFDYAYGYLDQKQAHNYYPTHLWENGKWDKLDNPYMNVHKKLDPAKATDKDFEYFKGKDYSIDKMTEKALGFIKQNKSKPFFLYLPYVIPHVSLQAPEKAVQEYVGQFKEKPYYGEQGYASTKYPYSTYAAMITYLDTQVGIVMEQIKKLGLDENTIIMFSSDNGATFNGGVDAAFFNSVDGLHGLKMDVYEGGIREPFIARWPGKIPAGKTSDMVSVQYDMMATFADFAHINQPKTDGLSLMNELTGNSSEQKKHEYLYFEYPEKGGQLAIRMGDWKGVRVNIRQNSNAAWEIYNLKTDRNETKNVASEHPELIRKFEDIVKKEHTDSHLIQWEFLHPKIATTKAGGD